MQDKLKCAIYTRVSTDNQAEVEFNSCEAQEAKIKSFINSQENMEVFKSYSDPGFTGADLNRPALSEMLNDIKERKINLVISYKIDRLTRSPKDFYQLIELFDKYGVDFISVTERFDTSTPSGRLLRNIMLTFAQFERELTSERTKDKMIERANKGMWNGGVIPFGYNLENKKFAINEEEAKIVKNIFDSYVSSESLSGVYNELKYKNLKDRDGHYFSKSRIYYILRNIVYLGKHKYAEKIYRGLHQPIITENTFNLVQETRKKKKRMMRMYKDYVLAGLIKCKDCNSSMTPCHTNKKKRDKIERYYYYRCTKTFKRDWDSCTTRQVSANRLENYISQNLERISLDRHYIDSLIFKLNNSQAGDRIGLEPSQVCFESAKISGEIFAQTLQHFVKGLFKRKGIEKNLWAKQFIKRIDYSKEEISITLYYKVSCEEKSSSSKASGWVGAAAGRNSFSAADKKITPISTDRGNRQDWLPCFNSSQTIALILPNTIHGSKKKDL